MSSTFTMDGRAMAMEALLVPDQFAPLTGLTIALTRTVPVANTAPSQLTQPDPSGGYVAQNYGVGVEFWQPTGFGEFYNAAPVNFPQVTASWGRMLGYAVIASDRSKCLSVGALAEPFIAEIGMIPYLPPGTIVLGFYD